MKYKIVLLKKEDKTSSFWNYLLQNKKIINLKVEQIIKKYDGFEEQNLFLLNQKK